MVFPRNRAVLAIAFFSALPVFAAPVATPKMTPEGGTGPGPLKVVIRCETPDAVVHVTYDGSEPTTRDPEVESDAAVLVDEPLVLKARAFLPDGSGSATRTAAFPLLPLPGNAVGFSEQMVPALMAVGREYTIALTMHNIGRQPWARGAFSLVANRATDAAAWNFAPVPLSKMTPTWGDSVFRFKVTAPAAPGTYSLRFRMAFNGQPFGEPTPSARVAVVSVEEFERESKTQRELSGGDWRGATGTAAAASKPMTPELAAALSKAKSAASPAAAATLDRLVAELRRSPRSFQYLRSIGFAESDEAFGKILAAYPGLFRSARIIRRDEKGQRIIPGWPAIALH